MTVLDIGGTKVSVPSSFLKLSPDEQNSFVGEIANSLKISLNPTVAERSDMTGSAPTENAAALQSALDQKVQQPPGYLGQANNEGMRAVSESLKSMGEGLHPGAAGSDKGFFEGMLDGPLAVGKGVLSAAGLPFAYPYAAASSLVANPMASAIHGVGSLLGSTSGPTQQQIYSDIRPGVENALTAVAPGRVPKMPVKAPSTGELFDAYKIAKESPEVAAVQIKPEAMAGKADDLSVKLDTEWLDSTLTPKVHHILDRLTNPPEGAVVTMQNVDSARRRLGKMAGRGDEEAAAAQIAKKELDKWIGSEVGPADVLSGDPALAQQIMQEGRQNYARGKVGEAFDEKLTRAESGAATTGDGTNLQNQYKQKINQFLQSDKSRSLNTSEREALQSYVDGSVTEKGLRYVTKWVSNMLGGVLKPAADLTTGLLANTISARKAKQLSEMIRLNSPLGRAVQSSAEKWNEAHAGAIAEPTSGNLSKFLIASRNLSNTMQSAGVSVSPAELFKSLQGPVGASAQDEQQ